MLLVNLLIWTLTTLRWLLGIIFLLLGILGAILPVIPGWPFIIPAILLLGRRSREIRYSHLLLRHQLRRLRRARRPWLRRAGHWLSGEYVRTRRLLMPAITAIERAFQPGLRPRA